jgi:hypothetical protein
MGKRKICETAADVIQALGGNRAVAVLCGVGYSAVSNYKRAGFPPRVHHILYLACREAGVRTGPNVFPRTTGWWPG